MEATGGRLCYGPQTPAAKGILAGDHAAGGAGVASRFSGAVA